MDIAPAPALGCCPSSAAAQASITASSKVLVVNASDIANYVAASPSVAKVEVKVKHTVADGRKLFVRLKVAPVP